MQGPLSRAAIFSGNRLLDALPASEASSLTRELIAHDVERGEIIYRQGHEAERVFFPLSGVISLVTTMADGTTVELATVGREGFVGVHVMLQARTWGNGEAFTQVAGSALSIGAAPFEEAFRRSGPLRRVASRYAQALLCQIGQGVACNRLHPVEQRASRWLLMTHDRAGSDRFRLTHEFLAQMLGVRRPTVTVAAGMLQRAGMIRYSRGVIQVLDRAALVAASCECYGVVQAEFERLLPARPRLL